jgi:uncharacterized protein YbaP (TraB family)
MFAYQIEGKSIQIIGSVHLLPERYREGLQALLSSLLESSERLVPECDFDIPPDLRSAHLPGGAFLRNSIDPRLYRRLVEQGKRFDLAEADIAQAKPWRAGLLFSIFHAGANGYLEQFGVDRLALNTARNLRKEVYPLESPESGFHFFNKSPRPEQVKFLRFAVEKQQESIEELAAIVRGWEMGDAGILETVRQSRLSETPQLFGGLISERNRLWFEKIEACIQDGKPTVVVVGALHLVGADGLIEGLTRLGHVLTPVLSDIQLVNVGNRSTPNTGPQADA